MGVGVGVGCVWVGVCVGGCVCVCVCGCVDVCGCVCGWVFGYLWVGGWVCVGGVRVGVHVVGLHMSSHLTPVMCQESFPRPITVTTSDSLLSPISLYRLPCRTRLRSFATDS